MTSTTATYTFGKNAPEIGSEVSGEPFILGCAPGRNIIYNFRGTFQGECADGFMVSRTYCSAHHEEVTPWWMDAECLEADEMTARKLRAA